MKTVKSISSRIDITKMSLIENVNLFDSDSAIAYAGLATNANNEVGVSYMIGGAVFPSHVVGIISNNRVSVVTSKGQRSPLPDSQGHYECTLFGAGGYTFVGTKDGGNPNSSCER